MSQPYSNTSWRCGAGSNCNWKGPRGIPWLCVGPQTPATLHIHHCRVRPWGRLSAVKASSQIAVRASISSVRCNRRLHASDARSVYVYLMSNWRGQRGVSARPWSSNRSDFSQTRSEPESFLQMWSSQAWLHSRRHAATRNIKHSPPLWNTLDRDQCDRCFFFI